MLTFIDDYSSYVWFFLVKEKSQAIEKFEEFKEKVEEEFKVYVLTMGENNIYIY